MKRISASHGLYLLVVLSLLLSQSAFASGAPKLFDSALPTPRPFDSPLPTPTPTMTETVEPTATITATVTPAPTPSPTLTPAPSASPTVSPSPTPTAVLTPSLALTLTVEPGWVEPAGTVTFTLELANPSLVPLPGVSVSDTLPGGLVFVPGSMRGLPLSKVRPLTWRIDALAPGGVISGTFQARLFNLTVGETVTNTVGASSPALATPLAAAAPVDVVPPASSETWASPLLGGWLRSPDDRLLLRIPPGAVTQRTRFRYSAWPEYAWLPIDVRFVFRLEATAEDGTPVHAFPVPLRLSLQRRAAEWPARGGEVIGYYDETQAAWLPIPTRAERARWQLHTTSPHLTDFAVMAAADSQPGVDRMSQVRGAQTDLYSRSITYDYPFNLPPGPGGLTPSLGLRYSSAEHSLAQGHYSVVGHGWALAGADFVYRDPYSDTLTLSLGGRHYTLPKTGTGAVYAKEDPTLAITASEDIDRYFSRPAIVTYTVRTAGGTRYTFSGKVWKSDQAGYLEQPMEFNWCGKLQDGNWRDLKWVRLPLTQVQDRSGNTITLTWEAETSDNLGQGCDTYGASLHYYVRAIHLKSISYAGGRVGVDLTYGSRVDRAANDTIGSSFWTDKKLETVNVWAVPDSISVPVRSYVLTYAGQDPNANAKSQLLLNLTKVSDVAGGLSETTSFDYSAASTLTWLCSHAYLTKVQNAYGGEVKFEAVPGVSLPSNPDCGPDSGYWQPYQITNRTETDLVTGQENAWTYGSSSDWNKDAYGFSKVWVTRPGADGAEIHRYHQTATLAGKTTTFLAGREYRSELCQSAGGGVCNTQLQLTKTTWVSTTADLPIPGYGGLSADQQPHFVYAAETQTAEAGQALKRTTYEYRVSDQSGQQFGNLTRVQEFEGLKPFSESDPSVWAATPLRTTRTTYFPNSAPTIWVINRPASTQVYVGNEGTLASEEHFYYDNAIDYQLSPPDRGLLTGDERVPVVGSGVKRSYGYDGYGNQNFSQDENGNHTTTYYDAWFHAYPVCVEDALGHRSQTYYYGVPGETTCASGSGLASHGGQFGQVEHTVDANGAVNTYVYDDLGRPLTVTVAPDTPAIPTKSYAYRPFGSMGSGQPFWVHTIRTQFHGGWSLVRQGHVTLQRDHMPDLQRVLAHYNALDQQLQERLLLGKSEMVQALTDMLAEGAQALQNFLSPVLLLVQLCLLALLIQQTLPPDRQLLAALAQFVEANDLRLVGIHQPAFLALQPIQGSLPLSALALLLLRALSCQMGKLLELG